MRLLDHVEPAAAIFGGIAPGVQRLADEGTIRRAGSSLISAIVSTSSTMPGSSRPVLAAIDLRREDPAIEVVELLVEDADEDDVLGAGVLQMREPRDHFAAVQPVGATQIRLAGLLRERPRAGPGTIGSKAAPQP